MCIDCQDGDALTQVESMLNACLANPILYCCFENVDFDVCYCFEFDAIPCHACFAEISSECLGQVLLVLYSHNVDGNASCISTDTDFDRTLWFFHWHIQ